MAKPRKIKLRVGDLIALRWKDGPNTRAIVLEGVSWRTKEKPILCLHIKSRRVDCQATTKQVAKIGFNTLKSL